MRTCSTELRTHLDQDVTSLAFLVTMTPPAGDVIYMTNHLIPITYEGEVFRSDIGVEFSAIYATLVAGAQGLEIRAFLSEDGITEAGVRTRLYHSSQVTVDVINWRDLTQGHIRLFSGRVGGVRYHDKDSVNFDLVPQLSRDQFVSAEVYSPSCRADLGDSRCTVGIDELSEVITVVSSTGSTRFTIVPLFQAANYWQLGVIVWDTGANAGIATEVGESTVIGGIKLLYPTPFPIAVGDTGTIYPGCNKQLRTCWEKFDNAVNFRGEPFYPPAEVLTPVPAVGGSSGGSSTPSPPREWHSNYDHIMGGPSPGRQ